MVWYCCSERGGWRIGGVCAACNAGLIINAIIHVLSVGTVSLISHAAGRKDQADANLVFNQSLGLSAACGLFTLIAGSVLARSYMRSIAADHVVVEAGTNDLVLVISGFGVQVPVPVLGSSLCRAHILGST